MLMLLMLLLQLQLLLLKGVTSVQIETVLNTTDDEWDKWTYEVEVKSERIQAWKKRSTLMRGFKHSMGVCNVAIGAVPSWVISPPFRLNSSTKSLHIELKFTSRSCEKFPDNYVLKQCKENFDLLASQSANGAAVNSQLVNISSFKHVATVAAKTRWIEAENETDFLVNSNTYSLSINNSTASIRIALRDKGSCTTLLQVRVYYLLCPSQVRSFTEFPRTPAAYGANFLRVRGSCVANAQLTQPGTAPLLMCKANGRWSESGSSATCHCSPGYRPSAGNRCSACPVNTYKATAGSATCNICPGHSHAPAEGADNCRCRSGYYRAEGDETTGPCTKPPQSPSSAIAIDNGDGTGSLSWQPPGDSGGRRDLHYFVQCHLCSSSSSKGLTYSPGQHTPNTSLLVRGLQADTDYEFRIYARNGVSAKAAANFQAWRSVILRVGDISKGSSKINSISMEIVSPTSVQINWEKPEQCNSDQYQVKIFPKLKPTRVEYHYSNERQFRLSGLDEGSTYLVMVRCRLSNDNFGEFSDAISINTKIPDENQQLGGQTSGNRSNGQPADKSIHIIIGAVVAVLLCLVIVLTMIILMSRRGFLFAFGKSKMLGEKSSPSPDCGMLPYSSVGTEFHLPHQLKPYVDPHTYEDPGQAVQEFAKEINSSWITIDCVLGGGEFGDVCKGVLRSPGRQEKLVAIKTLKPGASDKNKLDFMTEASIMGQFDDPNVISLEGVVTRSHPAMIVTEFMANGSLDAFLRNHDGELNSCQLVQMLRGIASGMRYLSSMSFIHRDLAARNILVNEQLVCKVADFGLSREVEADTYSRDGTYTTRGGKIPIRWTAPEAIHFRKFTSATDVWSFGIVMWEVMAFGERPYWNWSNQDVVAAVENGYRLPPPMDCPESVHSLMLQCWRWERSERPRFSHLVPAIDELLMQPHLLSSDHSAVRRLCEPPATTLMQQRHAVGKWLAAHQLERYADTFYTFGVNSMDLVQRLTAADLQSMGITGPSQQKRLLQAVQNVKMHVYEATPYSDGYMV